MIPVNSNKEYAKNGGCLYFYSDLLLIMVRRFYILHKKLIIGILGIFIYVITYFIE
jgi:hypothetical protein